MATEAATLEKPAGDLGNPEVNPIAEGAKARTTADVEQQLRDLLGGEAETAADPGKESPPEQAATETGEVETGAEAETETETPAEERTQWPDSAQKRVDKLTAQKAEARERADALQAEKDELERRLAEAEQNKEPAAPMPTPGDPLAFITTPKALTEYTSAVKQHLRNIEDYFGEELDERGREQLEKFAGENGAWSKDSGEFDGGKLKQLRRYAQDALQDHIPQRLEYLKAEATASQQAEGAFPWLKDRKSAEYGLYQGVLQAMPEIRKVPHWKAVAAVYVRGLQAVKADQEKTSALPNKGNGNGKGPAKTPAPKLPGAAQAIPQRPAADANQIETLRAKATKSRDPKDYERLLRANLEEVV